MIAPPFHDTTIYVKSPAADARADKLLAILQHKAKPFVRKYPLPVEEGPKVFACDPHFEGYIKALRSGEVSFTVRPLVPPPFRYEKLLTGKARISFQKQYGYDYKTYVGEEFIRAAKLRIWQTKFTRRMNMLLYIGKLTTGRLQILPIDEPEFVAVREKMFKGPRWGRLVEDRMKEKKEKIKNANGNYYLQIKSLPNDDPAKQRYLASAKKYKDARKSRPEFKDSASKQQKIYKAKLETSPELAAERREKNRLAAQKYREKKKALKQKLFEESPATFNSQHISASLK